MFDSKIDLSESQRRDACGACGTIMTLGWEATLEQDTPKRRKGKSKPGTDASKAPKTMIYSCGACSKKTRISSGITKPPGRHRKAMSNSSSNPVSIVTNTTPQATSTPTPSSKKRQKSKKGGLAAILAKNQASQSSSGFGLDLMDFMKKYEPWVPIPNGITNHWHGETQHWNSLRTTLLESFLKRRASTMESDHSPQSLVPSERYDFPIIRAYIAHGSDTPRTTIRDGCKTQGSHLNPSYGRYGASIPLWVGLVMGIKLRNYDMQHGTPKLLC
ncbi:uncharacterized protein L3040_000316 [Drepanopeziza brunnea f. sp. 'multigermtubi']|uniref:uncharacterized protein n=1 Tax=Drepanopeziza brunnea f. sp. 'multigermtubi' TaxID=698441 RepID=UPI00239C537C|nr:hypothetical protein L3040_000316 [Drepanopeziza brunnea f. sp. 'multigermtubi']